MYRVIGADYKEYGPVDAEQVRRWLYERRLNSNSLIQPHGATGWQPVSSIPEFAAVLAQLAPMAPTAQFTQAPGQNTMAVAGVIFSSLGLFCCLCGPLFAVLGIVFSIVALSQIKSTPGQRGRELAIAGIVLGGLGLLEFGLISLAGVFGQVFHIRHF